MKEFTSSAFCAVVSRSNILEYSQNGAHRLSVYSYMQVLTLAYTIVVGSHMQVYTHPLFDLQSSEEAQVSEVLVPAQGEERSHRGVVRKPHSALTPANFPLKDESRKYGIFVK